MNQSLLFPAANTALNRKQFSAWSQDCSLNNRMIREYTSELKVMDVNNVYLNKVARTIVRKWIQTYQTKFRNWTYAYGLELLNKWPQIIYRDYKCSIQGLEGTINHWICTIGLITHRRNRLIVANSSRKDGGIIALSKELNKLVSRKAARSSIQYWCLDSSRLTAIKQVKPVARRWHFSLSKNPYYQPSSLSNNLWDNLGYQDTSAQPPKLIRSASTGTSSLSMVAFWTRKLTLEPRIPSPSV